MALIISWTGQIINVSFRLLRWQTNLRKRIISYPIVGISTTQKCVLNLSRLWNTFCSPSQLRHFLKMFLWGGINNFLGRSNYLSSFKVLRWQTNLRKRITSYPIAGISTTQKCVLILSRFWNTFCSPSQLRYFLKMFLWGGINNFLDRPNYLCFL